jgi:hypothetical protein
VQSAHFPPELAAARPEVEERRSRRSAEERAGIVECDNENENPFPVDF